MTDFDETLALELERLNEQDRAVLIMHYGLNDGRAQTFQAIGNVFGVTRERIRQRHQRAFLQLRCRDPNDPLHRFVKDKRFTTERWDIDGAQRLLTELEASFTKVRRQYPRAHESWSRREERRLRKLFAAGSTFEQIAGEFGRRPGAIKAQLKILRLLV